MKRLPTVRARSQELGRDTVLATSPDKPRKRWARGGNALRFIPEPTLRGRFMQRVVVIGAGQMGFLHSGIVGGLSTPPLGMADRDPRLMGLANKILPSVRFYTDYVEMIRQCDPTIVYVCVPPQHHLEVVSDVLAVRRPNLALFVEKPLAGNSRDADKLVALADGASAVTMVGFQRRFLPTMTRAKALLESGIIGPVKFVKAHDFVGGHLASGTGWRSRRGSGGATLEYGIHMIDLLVWLFGDAKCTNSSTVKVVSSEVEDYVNFSLMFESGVPAFVDMGWSMRTYRGGDALLEIHGERGAIAASEDYVTLFRDGSGADPSEGPVFERTHWTGLHPRLRFYLGGVPNVLQDEYFLNCVGSGIRPQPDFASAAKVNRLIDTIVNGG